MRFNSLTKGALACLGVTLLNTPALATDEAEILVTASRVAETVDETLASVTVITREEIERRQAQSVQDLLRGVPGVSIANNGGAGKSTSIFLRGTESDHVLVMIDGVKVGSATLGTTAFQHIPVSQIERIEVVRGPRSSLYGSEALGGVIQIFTRKGSGTAKPFFSIGYGEYETRETVAGISGSSERGWFNLSASGTDTEGFDACRANLAAGCFANEPDKDGYENRSVALSTGYRFDNGVDVDAHLLRATGDTDFDGGFQNEAESIQQVASASVRFSPAEEWLISLTLGRSQDESDNFLNGIPASRFDTERDTISWQNDIIIADEHLLIVGVDYQDDKVDSTTTYAETSRDNTGLFTQFQGTFAEHDLQAAVRRDDNEQFGKHTTGSIAWGYALSGKTRFTASYGTAFKAPSFNELYFPGFGNPNLGPEESSSIELGISGTAGFGKWSVNVFQTRVDDLIAYDASILAPNNINEALIRGIEATVTSRIDGWNLSTSLSLLDPENRSPGANRGNALPRRVRESLRLDADRQFNKLSLGTTLFAAGKRYDDLANTRELDGYVTVDLRAEYQLAKSWRLQARLENAFDEEYETAAFYNQPGRGLFLTLRYAPEG